MTERLGRDSQKNDPPQTAPSTSLLSTANREARARLGKSRLNTAFALQVAGNAQKAKDALADAVRSDPDLINDGGALGLACHLYGVERPQAGVILFELSQQPVEASHYRPAFDMDVQARATGIELGIVFLITTIFGAVYYVGVQRAGVSLFSENLEKSSLALRQTLSTLAVGDLLVNAFRNGILWFLTLFSGVVFAFVIGTLAGGTGAVGKFIRYLMRPLMFLMLACSVGLTISLVGVKNSTDALKASEDMIVIGVWTIYIAAIITFFGLVSASTRAHNYGVVRAVCVIIFGSLVSLITMVLLGVVRLG